MQHHWARAPLAAALSAFLVLASVGTAAADAGDVAIRRAIRVAQGGPGGGPPSKAPSTADTPALATWAGTPTNADLPGILAFSIEHTPDLASAKIDIAIAAARVQEASGIFDWRVGANVDVVRNYSQRFQTGFSVAERTTSIEMGADVGRLFSTGGTANLHVGSTFTTSNGETIVEGLPITFDEENWLNVVTATITQPLLRGRGSTVTRAPIRRAELARDAAVLQQRAVAIAAVQSVVAGYWDLALSERQLAIRRSGLDLIRERRRLTDAGIQGGRVAPSELLAVDQAVATQQEQILAAEVGVVNASINLRRAAGMPIEPGAIALASGADASAPARVATLDQSLERAYATSPELAQLVIQDKDATIEVEVTENGLLPRLDAALTAGPTGFDNHPSEAWKKLAKFEQYAIVGSLTFEYDLGNNAARGRHRAALLGRDKIRVNATDVRAQIAQAVAQQVVILELAAQRVILAQTAIDLARKNIDVEQSRFSLGKSTNFDVLQRQNELQQAELSKAQAEIDARKAEAALSALTGDLLAEYGIQLAPVKR